MHAGHRVSRRHVLATSAAAGGLIVVGGHRAPSQPAKRIEQYAPELDSILSSTEPVQELASGTGGALGPTEGPLWWKEGSYLLYSDIHNNRRMKYVPGQGAFVAQEPVNRSNGLTRDLQGRLVACERVTRRVTRQEPDGSITVIAGSFQGRQLNIPNDVIVKSDGSIYFSDPPVTEQWDLGYPGVYRVSPDLGTMTLLANDLVFPNGLAFSPDESVLYITDFRRGVIRAFDVAPNGTLAKQTDRVFADLTGPEPGGPDGMKVDVAGNVYCGGGRRNLHSRSKG
jgi:gluconolactonase